MEQNSIDIVIVNWNAGDLLSRCVGSLLKTQSVKLIGKIIIVDNASSDSSVSEVAVSEKIHWIKNTENRGFSVACNQGFRAASAPYVLLLNPDAAVFDVTLEACLKFMNGRKDIDILGCRLVNDEGKTTVSCARFPTPWRYCTDAIGISKLFPKLFPPATLMTDWNHLESKEVDQVMGAFMLIRKSTLSAMNGFDERFFVYYEELDFSKRVSEQKGKIFFNADIKALHSGGGTTCAVKAFRLYLSLSSRLHYARKHFSAIGYGVTWLSTYLVEPWTRMLFCFVKADLTGITQVWNGYYLLISKGKKERFT